MTAASVQINLDAARAEHEKLLDTAWSEPARTSGAEVRTAFVDENAAVALVDVAARESADASSSFDMSQIHDELRQQLGPIAGFVAGSVALMLPRLLHCPMAAVPSV